MLEQIGSYEAKTKLPEILRRVEAGEAFTVTNRGKPIADIIPSRARDQAQTQAAIDTILTLQQPPISNVNMKALREHGRK